MFVYNIDSEKTNTRKSNNYLFDFSYHHITLVTHPESIKLFQKDINEKDFNVDHIISNNIDSIVNLFNKSIEKINQEENFIKEDFIDPQTKEKWRYLISTKYNGFIKKPGYSRNRQKHCLTIYFEPDPNSYAEEKQPLSTAKNLYQERDAEQEPRDFLEYLIGN